MNVKLETIYLTPHRACVLMMMMVMTFGSVDLRQRTWTAPVSTMALAFQYPSTQASNQLKQDELYKAFPFRGVQPGKGINQANKGLKLIWTSILKLLGFWVTRFRDQRKVLPPGGKPNYFKVVENPS